MEVTSLRQELQQVKEALLKSEAITSKANENEAVCEKLQQEVGKLRSASSQELSAIEAQRDALSSQLAMANKEKSDLICKHQVVVTQLQRAKEVASKAEAEVAVLEGLRRQTAIAKSTIDSRPSDESQHKDGRGIQNLTQMKVMQKVTQSSCDLQTTLVVHQVLARWHKETKMVKQAQREEHIYGEGLMQVRSLQEKLAISHSEHTWHDKQHENHRRINMQAESNYMLLQAQLKQSEHRVHDLERENKGHAMLQAQLKRSEHKVDDLERERKEQIAQQSELQAELERLLSKGDIKHAVTANATVKHEVTQLNGRMSHSKDQQIENLSHQLAQLTAALVVANLEITALASRR
eukprot:gnl/MRDRNA2_/MRDRNA2_55754_c0_seq1.p1 gnl/MRDRNA2_/MRDRNA2_55754_c0~~gnl/MRDRNA2_/MRDRNA2_55754_c0_seq1.p1  ORF type:complete len:383 (-),score=92.08 gnl/MRDRNA2_/MRDRNA2_55754_c0_seq1:271-1323(-)